MATRYLPSELFVRYHNRKSQCPIAGTVYYQRVQRNAARILFPTML